MTGQLYPTPAQLLRNSQAGLHAATTRIGWTPPARGTVGRCTSTLPLMVDGHTDLWCELAADHTGAHQDGTTTWMTRPESGGSTS